MNCEGGCACGAIRFTIETAPLGTGACHCTNCQKFSGGGPNYVALLPKGALRVACGTPRLFCDRGDSGGEVQRAFCPDCGTPLWSIPEHAPFMTVKVGAFDESADLGPGLHVYCVSAPKWHPIPDGATRFEKMPPPDTAPA